MGALTPVLYLDAHPFPLTPLSFPFFKFLFGFFLLEISHHVAQAGLQFLAILTVVGLGFRHEVLCLAHPF